MAAPPSDALARQVAAAADPGRVRTVLDRLGPRVRDLPASTLDAVVAVAGASDTLGALLAEDPLALGVVEDLGAPPRLAGVTPETLAATYRRELLRIAAGDLLGADVVQTMTSLSQLAGALVRACLALADAETLVVVAMGKLGAGELNVVSDIDLAFVAAGDPEVDLRAARRFLALAGRCVRVDTDLRPEGRDGPLVRTLESWEAHWERWAAAWEFQALLKATAVAGPADHCRAFDDAAARALWSRPFGADDLRAIRTMKARAEQEVVGRRLSDREIKRAPGGIRDIEFSAQLLQLVHGGADPALRVRATLPALEQLSAGGYVDRGEAETLVSAYRFLRRVEHHLQLVAERQTHVIPADRDARRRLARTLGYRGDADAGPTDQLDHDVSRHRLAVRRVHESWYFRPLLDAFASGERGEPAAAMSATRLAAFGFRDPVRTEQAVRELSHGLTRTSRLMRQLLPLVLDWLSSGPDPDRGLLGLRRLATGQQRTMELAHSFRDSAERARQLCLLIATAPAAVDILEANPDLVERLDDVTRLRTASRDHLLASAWDAVGWRDGLDDQQGALLRWFRRNLLGIVARDVAGVASSTQVAEDLTTLVEVVLETAVRVVDPPMPFTVVGMGRLGGRELSYASDVDLVFVDGGGDRAAAERAAAGVIRLVHGATPASRIVAVDADLRPEGRQGPLARSLESYDVYLQRWAEAWERQALLRARPVAGDTEVGHRFLALVDREVHRRPPDDAERRGIRRLKARVEAERIDRGPVSGGTDHWRHLKLGPGGLADVEWTVQLLQWEAGIPARRTDDAIGRLVERGALDGDDAAVLRAAHAWCDQVRNRGWLGLGHGDVIPEAVEPLRVLARSLDLGPDELVERHRRHLRRSRRVVERLFYGRP